MASLGRILNYFRGYWGVAAFSIGLSGVFEWLDLLVPYAIGQILNIVSRQPLDGWTAGAIAQVATLLDRPVTPQLSLGILMAVVFVVTVIRAPVQPWVGLWFHWVVPLQARRDRQADAVAKLLTLPLEFYDDHNPGRIAGRIARGILNHTWSYPELAGQLIPKLMRVAGIFGVMALINLPIALIFGGSFAAILGFTLRDLRRLIAREALLDRYIENTESRTSELVTNIKTVKAFATEAQEYQRQRQRFDRELQVVIHRIHRGYVRLATWQRTAIQTSGFAVLALLLGATLNGTLSLGYFVTLLTIANMAYAELEPISSMAEVFARRYASMARFHEFMDEAAGLDAGLVLNYEDAPVRRSPACPASPASVAERTVRYQFTGKVHFDHVTFGYDPARPVLQDINVVIEPRQTVALVGRSGSGKSTLVKLLFRYFAPSAGAVLIDGLDIQRLDVTAYRQRLAIVHQEVDVFNGTLLANLRYGNPRASLEQVAAACAIARVDEFLDQLPNGYQTVVGERGLRLSGGQRQRLGIARALLVDPDVLVFDEATSSLDTESERAIQDAMHRILGTRTTIVIAHRLSTIRDADRIIVLDRGHIAETGNHAELLAQRGVYHRLHQLQAFG
jgi:ATP-binding cassette subfamily B protein